MRKQKEGISKMFLVPQSIYLSVRNLLTDQEKLKKLDQLNPSTNYIENAIQYNNRSSFKTPIPIINSGSFSSNSNESDDQLSFSSNSNVSQDHQSLNGNSIFSYSTQPVLNNEDSIFSHSTQPFLDNAATNTSTLPVTNNAATNTSPLPVSNSAATSTPPLEEEEDQQIIPPSFFWRRDMM